MKFEKQDFARELREICAGETSVGVHYAVAGCYIPHVRQRVGF